MFGSEPGIFGPLAVSKSVTLLSTRLLIAMIFGFSRSTTGDTSSLSVESVSSRANDFSLLSKLYLVKKILLNPESLFFLVFLRPHCIYYF